MGVCKVLQNCHQLPAWRTDFPIACGVCIFWFDRGPEESPLVEGTRYLRELAVRGGAVTSGSLIQLCPGQEWQKVVTVRGQASSRVEGGGDFRPWCRGVRAVVPP